jgi:hypothetical protein
MEIRTENDTFFIQSSPKTTDEGFLSSKRRKSPSPLLNLLRRRAKIRLFLLISLQWFAGDGALSE